MDGSPIDCSGRDASYLCDDYCRARNVSYIGDNIVADSCYDRGLNSNNAGIILCLNKSVK